MIEQTQTKVIKKTSVVLPTERSKVEDYNPKLMVLFGKPKSGKSTIVANIDDNLIIDLEDGYRSLSVMKLQAKNATDLFNIKQALAEKEKETGKHPYKYITIDNASRLEEFALPYAGKLYQNTEMGKKWGYKKDDKGIILLDKNGRKVPDPTADIRNLPSGNGYLYLRTAVKKLISMFQPYCDTLILVAHVKEKQILKNGEEMSEMSVDLAGKLASIICGEADAIGYVMREKNQTIISFEGGDDTIREARPIHLRGKRIVVAESDENNNLKVDLSKIFV